MTGASVRFYVVCWILMTCGMGTLGNETSGTTGHNDGMFAVVVVVMTALIWLYTRQGGIKRQL